MNARFRLLCFASAFTLVTASFGICAEDKNDVEPDVKEYSLKLVETESNGFEVAFGDKPEVDTSSPQALVESYAVFADGRTSAQEMNAAMNAKVRSKVNENLSETEKALFAPKLLKSLNQVRETRKQTTRKKYKVGDKVDQATVLGKGAFGTTYGAYVVSKKPTEVDGKSWLLAKRPISILKANHQTMKIIEIKEEDYYRFHVVKTEDGYRIADVQYRGIDGWATFLTPIARNDELIRQTEEELKIPALDTSSAKNTGDSFLNNLFPDFRSRMRTPYAKHYREIGKLMKSMVTEDFVKSQKAAFEEQREIKREKPEVYRVSENEDGSKLVRFTTPSATLTVCKAKDKWLISKMTLLDGHFKADGTYQANPKIAEDWQDIFTMIQGRFRSDGTYHKSSSKAEDW